MPIVLYKTITTIYNPTGKFTRKTMQRTIILLSLLSPSCIASINERLITIENASTKIVTICYKEHGCKK